MPTNSRYERKQIAVMGRQGVGKSSLVKALSVKNKNIADDNSGADQNQIEQILELLPFAPLVLKDTIAIDKKDELGKKKVSDTIKTISTTDLVILVLDARENISSKEWELLNYLTKISVPFILAVNKIEYGVNPDLLSEIKLLNTTHYEISCTENVGIDSLKTKVMRMLPQTDNQPFIGDIISQGDVVVMVVPNDLEAQKRREIIPQIQTIRESLDEDATIVLTKIKELRSTLYALKNLPDLILTDSQTIIDTFAEIPEDIKITTFSTLNTRKKGNLQTFIKGLKAIENLNDEDKVLVVEACAHHNQNYNIGSGQITEWLRLQTKKKLIFDYNNSADLPEDLSTYKLIVYCSGCMFTKKIILAKIRQAMLLDIPIVNYDIIISYINGSLPRILFPFEKASNEWEKVNLINSQL